MSNENNILVIIINSIKDDNLELLDKALRIIPLEKMDDKHELLLAKFLGICAGFNRGDASKLILERWKVIYPENEKISLFSRLFMKLVINTSILSYLASIHKDFTYVELIDELAEWDSSGNAITGCYRADEIFGEQPYDTYKMLRDRAIELGNFRVEEYLYDKIVAISPFVDKPEYVKNYMGKYFTEFKDRLPTQKELDEIAERESAKETDLSNVKLPDDERAVELMTEGLSSLGIAIGEIERAKEFLKKEISGSVERKKELLLPILKNMKEQDLDTDRLLFWIYGSSNPLISQNLSLDTPSAKYGGSRLFLCDLFDYNFDEGYLEDWFLGYCQECMLRIRHRHYAVRMPRPHGGFEGCFCTFDCVRKRLEFIEATKAEPDLLTHALIDGFDKKIQEIGIQDRTE